MNRQRKPQLLLLLTLILGSTSAMGLHAADAQESDLLQRSQPLAKFSTSDVVWAACLPSGNTVLSLRVTDAYEFTFFRRDLRSGTDTPLRALKKLYGNSLGYGHAISPDGNWLVWQNSQEEVSWATLDGQRYGKRHGHIADKLLWMADSRHWVEFVDKLAFQYTRAMVSDINTPGQSKAISMLPQSPLPQEDRRFPPVDLDDALFVPGGHLLVKRTSGGEGLNIDIFELDLERQGVPTHQFTVPLFPDVGLSALAFSPDGAHIGWLLRHRGKQLLCASRLDGSEMHLIGTLTVTSRNPNDPDDALNAEPSSLQWSSDGKSLTFLYQNTLYRAPASAADAPLASSLLLSRDHPIDAEQRRQEAFAQAIRKTDPASAKRLIAEGLQVNAQDSEGETPLMSAAASGQIETVRALLAAGADLNLRDRWGNTALIHAIEKDQEQTALLLLASGARVQVKGYFEQTALLVETRKGSEKTRSRSGADTQQPSQILITALLDHGADVNLPGYEGEKPLLNITKTGSLPLVEFLVSHGAKVNVSDALGSSPLSIAVQKGRIDLCTFLLDHGADPNVQGAPGKSNGETPLIEAASLGNIELCKLLMARGARVDKADPAGYRPLSNAVDKGNVSLARFFLDKGANPNIRFIDSSMLISAVLANRKEMVELLLQRGARINARGACYGSGEPQQKTALGWARAKHLDAMVRLLVKAGAKD